MSAPTIIADTMKTAPEFYATAPALAPETAPPPTKRGVNLGCGNVILPGPRPKHHALIPESFYTDPDIQWDNVDRNPAPGVNVVCDLFTYPWCNLPSNTYDVAFASHLIEHIPHHITWNGADWGGLTMGDFSPAAQELIKRFGQIIPHHPIYQDGWFAWFAELWRVMKPGGKVYLLFPHAWSDSGISDPTHTRYLTLASINYLNDDDDDAPMNYRKGSRWKMDLMQSAWNPHQRAVDELRGMYLALAAQTAYETAGVYKLIPPSWMEEGGVRLDNDDGVLFATMVYHKSRKELNALVEYCVMIEAVKDAD